MNWLNLETSNYHSAEFVSAPKVCQATWMSLMVFCIEQENGGRIQNCASWTTRHWNAAHLTPADVRKECQLWKWEGDDIVVKFYPLAHELRHQAQSGGGRKGGMSRSPEKTAAVRENGRKGGRPRKIHASQPVEAGLDATGKPKLNQSVIEGNGNEENGNGTSGELSGDKSVESGGSAVSLWARFPDDEDAARLSARHCGVTEDFAALAWNKALSRGKCDSRGNEIRHWAGFIRTEWRFEEERRKGQDGIRRSEQMKALENALKAVESDLRRVARPNANVLPDDYARSEQAAAPLRLKKKQIQAKIAELNAEVAEIT